MPAPKLFMWTDGNAPVCSGTRGALINILKKCLIDGYGDKTPVGGWTVEFENAESTIAVFRNNPLTGTGFFLKVNESTSANAYTATINGYELMTDIDAGIGLFQFNSDQNFPISNGANATARPWVVIADDRAFHFHCHTGSSAAEIPINGSGARAFFFGDIIPINPSDAFACLIARDSHTSGGAAQYVDKTALNSCFLPSGTGEAPNNMCMPRGASGAPGAVSCCHGFGGGPASNYSGSSAYMYPQIFGAAGAPSLEPDPIFISRPYLSGQTSFSVRGWTPGLYAPCHAVRFTPYSVLNESGKSFLVCATYGNSGTSAGYGQYLVSLDDWRA